MEYLRFQRAGVHSHPHRHAALFGRPGYRGNLLPGTDVPWVDTQAIYSGIKCSHGQIGPKMDVRNQGDGYLALDLSQRTGGGLVRNGHPHDLAASTGQPIDLGHGGLYVGGIGIGHGLDGYRRTTAYGHITNLDLTCCSSHLR